MVELLETMIAQELSTNGTALRLVMIQNNTAWKEAAEEAEPKNLILKDRQMGLIPWSEDG